MGVKFKQILLFLSRKATLKLKSIFTNVLVRQTDSFLLFRDGPDLIQ